MDLKFLPLMLLVCFVCSFVHCQNSDYDNEEDLIIIIIIIIIIWFGDTVTVSHSTKCDTNSKVRALS